MTSATPDQHVLKQLRFPDRYESLVKALGTEVARVVVAPDAGTADIFETLAEDIRARGQGMFVPIFAASGTGKSTLANNMSVFFPADYTQSVSFPGVEVSESALKSIAASAVAGGVANEARIIPIVIDGREGAPASESELSSIKRFLRDNEGGFRSVILWPETSHSAASGMADAYIGIAGSSVIKLPASVSGPGRESWQQIAIHTLELANNASDLEKLGVDPRSYDPDQYPSLGEFLRALSVDFTKLRLQILRSTQKPLRLSILFASMSSDAGVLSQFTNSSKYGFLDAGALLSATSSSVVGRYWSAHRGQLTQLIVQLDARAFVLPPQVTIPSLRRFGPAEIQADLEHMSIPNRVDRVLSPWSRSDVGRHYNGTSRETFETRGTPAGTSISAFQLLAQEHGLTSGKDKKLNAAMLAALRLYFDSAGVEAVDFKAEARLDFCPLIPDNSFIIGGDQHCVEYAWRADEYLGSKHRSDVAQYVLRKLQNYGRELGILAD